MKKLFLILALCGVLFAEEGVKKVVFDLTSGKLEAIEKKVLSGIAFNKTHYENKLEKLDVEYAEALKEHFGLELFTI